VRKNLFKSEVFDKTRPSCQTRFFLLDTNAKLDFWVQNKQESLQESLAHLMIKGS
jgi:hypothetical protein